MQFLNGSQTHKYHIPRITPYSPPEANELYAVRTNSKLTFELSAGTTYYESDESSKDQKIKR